MPRWPEMRRHSFRAAFTAAACGLDEWRLVGPRGVVADRVTIADTPWRRARGLIGRQELHSTEALVLAPCARVHTIGMRFPIDAIFCDADLRVVAVLTLQANRPGKGARGARCCIELVSGAAAEAGIEPGVTLAFERAP